MKTEQAKRRGRQRLGTSGNDELPRTVFAARASGSLVLAVAAASIPAIGPNRLIIAASVLVTILPFNIVLERWSRRHQRLPFVIIVGDAVVATAYVALAPTTWVPVLLLLAGDVGIATAAFGRYRAAIALALGTVALTTGGLLGGVPDPAVGVVSYLIAGGLLLMIVGAMFDMQHGLLVRHEMLLEDIDAIVWEADPDPCRFTYVSRRAEDILGFGVERWYESGFWSNQVHPADRDRVLAEDGAAIDAGLDHMLEYRMLAASGQVIHLRDMVTVVTDPMGQPIKLRGVMVDITKEREAEAQVRQYAELVERIQMALVIGRLTDPDDPMSLELIAANPTACTLVQRNAARIIGRRAVDIFPGIEMLGLPEMLANVVRTGESIDLDDVVSPGDPDERHYALHAFRIGENTLGVSIDDVTGPRLAAAALRHQATHDALTGLPNRVLLHDRLNQALRESGRTGGRTALLMMDLNQFKEINDALGHDHGDRLLVALSRRLEEILRNADTIARLGGDEFAVLLTTDAARAGAVTVARKITSALEQPFEIEGLTLQTNASIGIALFPDHGTDVESLTKRADVAMYTAKRSARPYSVYAPELDRSSVRRVTLLGELRRSLELEELELHYQPAYDLATGGIVGAEALLRWNHPRHGLLLPRDFIDLAEVSGLMQEVTRFVIERALATTSAWPDTGAPLAVAVNLSVRNLYDPDLCRWMDGILRDTGFPANHLTLELTESEMMDDLMLAVEVLSGLHALGLRTSIDDFGTGQSSLTYLKHLPIDELKIDRSFVAGLCTNESDATIVKSIIELGHNLGLKVVAEGVEDGETLARLVELGCDRAQGFHLSPPMHSEALAALLALPESARRFVPEVVSHVESGLA